MACIEARGLRKAFGTAVALDGIDLRVEQGRILGMIGPNGAGKTTALNAILGLTPFQGDLKVLGRDPWAERMPEPQRLPADLIEEGRAIPIARVQAMHEGKRRARAARQE